MKEKFDITGMTCSACSSRVEKSVSKLTGVNHVEVNLLTNSMNVDFDDTLSTNDIIKTVVDAGYGANVTGKQQLISNEVDHKKRNLIISIILLIIMMYISMHQMFHHMFGLPIPNFVANLFDGNQNAMTFAFTQFLILIPIIILNSHYYINGFKSLWHRSPNMDSLVAIGSSSAIIYGIVAIYLIGYGLGTGNSELVSTYSSNLYFESGAMIVTLISLGKYLESLSKNKTTEAIEKLIGLQPTTALVIQDGKEITKAIDQIMVGDLVVVKPSQRIPVDGIVVEGSSYVDESMISGESIPLAKEKNDTVVSGTLNQNGRLVFKTTKIGEDTTINQIIKLVEEASSSKAPISKLADKVAGIFVPIVIGLALLVLVIWLALGQTIEFALTMMICVLVISCPCALGLATPVAIMVGTGKGAQNGILIKSGQALEILHNVKTVVLDKTGTITKGQPEVSVIKTKMNEDEFLEVAYSLEKFSEHPLAKAINEYCNNRDIKLHEISDFEAIVGKGVQGKINDVMYFAGNKVFMEENNINITNYESDINELASSGLTPLIFSNDKEVIGIISVGDQPKDTSKEAISLLKKMHIKTVMLTGDNQLTANAIKQQVGVDEVIAGVLPEEKEKYVRNLQNDSVVAMVGDGINDAPALIKSDVGIAIGAGSDIAIDSADIILMRNDLLDVVDAIRLSSKVITNIKENLFWAFIYNVLCIPLAAGVFYYPLGITLSPMIGSIAMSFSSLFVVTNALRLKNFKINRKQEKGEIKKMEVTVKVDGMMCEHCKKRVHDGLSKLAGVENVDVNLDTKEVKITSTNEISLDTINEVVENEGYKLIK